MKHLAIVVDWYGPYSLSEAIHAAGNDGYSHGLYMAIGKQPYQRTSQIQYVGLSAWLANRLSNHNTLPKITKDLKLWLGAASTAEPAGKKKKTTTATLDYAEWLHAYFMKLPLNSKKTASLRLCRLPY